VDTSVVDSVGCGSSSGRGSRVAGTSADTEGIGESISFHRF